MSTPEPSELFAQIETLLAGIDRHEDDPRGGWWQTPDGARIGRIKLRELKELIGSHLATPPAATREAEPLPQAGAEISDEELAEVASAAGLAWETWEDELLIFARAVWDRAVLARWGGAAVPPNAAPTEEDLYDLADVFNGDPVPAIRRALQTWRDHATPPAAPDWRALCKELRDALAEYDGANPYHEHRDLITRVSAALATQPAVDEDERLRLVTAGISSGYIAGHESTVDGHYGDPEEVAADMAPMVLTEVAATPPAATREAGPLPQAGAEISDEELAEVASAAGLAWETWEVFNGDPVPAIRRALELWGGAAVQSVPVVNKGEGQP